jgi:hypothetical protein
MRTKTNPSAGEPRRKTFRHVKPTFVTLKEGEKITGLFLGEEQSHFGPVYKLKTADGNRLLAGNRFQLDSLLKDMRNDSEEFPSGGLEGHLLEISRLIENVQLEAGTIVAQFEVAHLIDGCPYGCGSGQRPSDR